MATRKPPAPKKGSSGGTKKLPPWLNKGGKSATKKAPPKRGY